MKPVAIVRGDDGLWSVYGWNGSGWICEHGPFQSGQGALDRIEEIENAKPN